MRYSLPKEYSDKVTEHQIQREIMVYLRMMGYYVQRLNSGKFSAGEGRSKRFIMGVATGTPDLMAFKWCEDEPNCGKGAHLLFVEVKRPGKKATDIQKAKMEELERYGARCLVATSIEDLTDAGL
jgi:hypothetical protein